MERERLVCFKQVTSLAYRIHGQAYFMCHGTASPEYAGPPGTHTRFPFLTGLHFAFRTCFLGKLPPCFGENTEAPREGTLASQPATMLAG